MRALGRGSASAETVAAAAGGCELPPPVGEALREAPRGACAGAERERGAGVAPLPLAPPAPPCLRVLLAPMAASKYTGRENWGRRMGRSRAVACAGTDSRGTEAPRAASVSRRFRSGGRAVGEEAPAAACSPPHAVSAAPSSGCTSAPPAPPSRRLASAHDRSRLMRIASSGGEGVGGAPRKGSGMSASQATAAPPARPPSLRAGPPGRRPYPGALRLRGGAPDAG